MSFDVHQTGILNYGSVELCLENAYQNGTEIEVSRRLHIKVVDRVEKADGIIVLATVPLERRRRPGCICVLFTHYMRHPILDIVDHAVTVTHLSLPSEKIRLMTERAFCRDLVHRSITSSFTYNPKVRYL